MWFYFMKQKMRKLRFEAYIEDNQDKIVECIADKDKYSYIQATNELDTKECKKG